MNWKKQIPDAFEVMRKGFSDKRKRFVLVRDKDLLYRSEIACHKAISVHHDNHEPCKAMKLV